jgi:hypothetical protein
LFFFLQAFDGTDYGIADVVRVSIFLIYAINQPPLPSLFMKKTLKYAKKPRLSPDNSRLQERRCSVFFTDSRYVRKPLLWLFLPIDGQ